MNDFKFLEYDIFHSIKQLPLLSVKIINNENRKGNK
jgi:hypothetical protein